MGAFFGNIAVRTTDKDSVIGSTENQNEPAYISGPVDGWILVFPENDFNIENIAREYSADIRTIVISGQVFDSDDFLFQVFDKGKLVFDFIEDKTSGAGITIKEGNITVLKKYATKLLNIFELESVFNKRYVFAEEKYRDVVNLLGLPEVLSHYWGFSYIEDGDMEEKIERELPTLTRHPDGASSG